jgi:hypothetical protein
MAASVALEQPSIASVGHHLEVIVLHAVRTANGIRHRSHRDYPFSPKLKEAHRPEPYKTVDEPQERG